MDVNLLSFEWVEPRDGESAARFKIKGLSGMDALKLMPELGINESGGYNVSGEGLCIAFARGLVDWEGHTSNGKEIPFASSNFDTVPPVKMYQIAMAVINKTSFTRGIEKNF